MDWRILAIRIALGVDFLIFATWVALYARVDWRVSPVGRHLMAFGVVIASLLGLTLVRGLLGQAVYWLWLLGLVALGAVGVQRTYLMLKLRHHDPDEEGR